MVLSCTRYGMVTDILIMSVIRRRISICLFCARGNTLKNIKLSMRLRVTVLVMDRRYLIRRCAFRLFVIIRMDSKLLQYRRMNVCVDLCYASVFVRRATWMTLVLLLWICRFIVSLVTWRLRLLLWKLFVLRAFILLRLRRKVRSWNRRLVLNPLAK